MNRIAHYIGNAILLTTPAKYLQSLAVLLVVFLPLSVYSVPFLKISSVDFESNFPSIKVSLSINGGEHGPVGDLNEDNISLFEDGYRVNYINVLRDTSEKEYLYFIFSIDASRSISPRNLEEIKNAAKEIITKAGANDEFAIYRFNDEVQLLNSFSGNRAELIKNVESVTSHGSRTQLLTSIYDSIELLAKAQKNRKAIIVFTDGIDEGSAVSSEDIVKFSREHGVPISFVFSRSNIDARSALKIAKLTGGKVVFGNSSKDIAALYSNIRASLGNQYTVKYKSMLNPDNKPHTIEVRLKWDTIRDRDSREIVLSKFFGKIEMPSLLQVLLIILMLILIVLLVFFIIYFIRRRKSIFSLPSSKYPELEKMAMDYSMTINLDEQKRIHKSQTITESDPEYVYSKAWLVQKDGPEVGKKFPIFWEEVTIGRGEENSIVVRDDAVSVKHSKIKEMKGAYYIFDLATENGTFLNGKKLLRPKPLYDWDEIKMGRTLLIFRGSKLNA
jgi:VWFA-related protein